MKFTEREPKSPRELEQFYLQTREKLQGTDESLASLCNQITEEAMIRDFSHEIRVVSERVDSVEMEIESTRNKDLKIRELSERIESLEQVVTGFSGLHQELRRIKDMLETTQNEFNSEA